MGEPHPMVEDMAKRTAKASRNALGQHSAIADHYASLPRDHPDRPAAKRAFENSLRRTTTARKRKYG